MNRHRDAAYLGAQLGLRTTIAIDGSEVRMRLLNAAPLSRRQSRPMTVPAARQRLTASEHGIRHASLAYQIRWGNRVMLPTRSNGWLLNPRFALPQQQQVKRLGRLGQSGHESSRLPTRKRRLTGFAMPPTVSDLYQELSQPHIKLRQRQFWSPTGAPNGLQPGCSETKSG